MMPAAKHLDPVVGIDIHIIQPPGPVPPLPIPHPFVGMIIDVFDYVPFVGATVLINGVPHAKAGTAGKAIPPHIPIGGMFVKPPANECEMFMGSSTVSFDGDAASYLALPALTCQCIGMIPPIRTNPKKGTKTKSLVLPTSVVLPIPTGPSVLIGGPPTISLMALGMRVAMPHIMKGLGKLLKAGKKLASKAMKALAKAAKAAAKSASKAAKAAAKALADAVGALALAIRGGVKKLRKLAKKRKARWDRDRGWKKAGIAPRHGEAMARFAKRKRQFLIVRHGNPKGLKHHGKPGFKPKPVDIKAKTGPDGIVQGPPRRSDYPNDEAFERANKAWTDDFDVDADGKWQSKKKFDDGTSKYTTDENGHVINTKTGDKYHPDYDMHGRYTEDGTSVDMGKGEPYNVPAQQKNADDYRQELNDGIGADDDMIQHGSQDEWVGADGPEPPVRIIDPDGNITDLEDEQAMKEFFEKQDNELEWPWPRTEESSYAGNQ